MGEHSSFFAGFNYQASSIANMIHYASSSGVVNPTMQFPPLMGAGVSIGYKQLFGKKHNIGVRYFGFFDYNHSRFGVLRSSDNPFAFGNTTFTEKDSYAGQYYANLYTYGVGIDMLYNFYTNKRFIFGMALGIQFAGDSWASSIQKDLRSYASTHKNSSYSPANFQFLVNFALRAQFAKHNGVELGIKVPTITHRYFSLTNAQGETLSADVRRLYAFQISYLRDF
ncbi:outer membrane protein [Helicobacter cynogastricus]|uniref:outer membrane protein n=1 Tax=Helicobacter cynogastricus TaxID=329937 RepID=UPI001F3F5897|nr:outer membrane protein [Helicobacter cynogastricus]